MGPFVGGLPQCFKPNLGSGPRARLRPWLPVGVRVQALSPGGDQGAMPSSGARLSQGVRLVLSPRLAQRNTAGGLALASIHLKVKGPLQPCG